MTRIRLNDGWSVRRKVTAFQELGGSSSSAWTDVVLPHDALIATERRADAPNGHTSGYFGGGAFEYRRSLGVPEADRGKQIFLELDGVYRDAMVYVNGSLAGQHAYGYSRFVVRLDPYLASGDNEIRVACRTHLDSRWYAGAGIYRDVHLVVKEPAHIGVDGVTITTPDIEADRALVAVAVQVENAALVTSTFRAVVTLADAHGTAVASGSAPVTVLPGRSALARLRLPVADPELWDVDHPTLYGAAVELRDGEQVLDAESVAFGIRSLQLDARRGLRINGQEVKLRGACIHSDNGPLGVAAIDRAEERKVELLKAAGFNAIRSSHHPVSSALLDACDRLGMLVMDETFDVWTSSKSDFDYAFDFAEWWERDVEAMVTKDRNHPSVIFYSIGNEIPETGTPIGAVWSRRLAEKVRTLDPTRFVTNGINGFVSLLDTVLPAMQAQRGAAEASPAGGVNAMMDSFGQMMGRIQASPQATERTEESYAVLDAAGMNYGDARYELDRDLFPDRVIIGTETWPTVIAQNWALVTANPHVIGDFTWTGWDYLGENGIGLVQYVDDVGTGASFSSPYPGLTAWCGDLDITGHRRPASYYRQIVFGLRAEPYIAVRRPQRHGQEIAVAPAWAWSDSVSSWSWAGSEGHPVTVEVYSDADEVELTLNGAVVARQDVGKERRFSAEFELDYAPGELVATAYRDGVVTGVAALTSAASDLVLQVQADRTELRADPSDLAFVALTLTDGAGEVHTDREETVTVTVSGSGVLAALGSANPSTEEPFDASSHQTFDGRALMIVRPTGSGPITVTASVSGCAASTTTLHAS